MNSTDPRHPWQRLVAATRRAPDDREVAAPPGFATRMAALAFSTDQASPSLFARFSLRALGVACLLMVASFASNYSALASVFAEDDPLLMDDPVAEFLEIVS